MEATHMKVAALNQLATELVGDGKKQNVFFVTLKGNVVLIALDFDQAYGCWRSLANTRVECALEDRQTGTIASAGIQKFDLNDNTVRKDWEVIDSSRMFGFRS
jgi:hypothetical protein